MQKAKSLFKFQHHGDDESFALRRSENLGALWKLLECCSMENNNTSQATNRDGIGEYIFHSLLTRPLSLLQRHLHRDSFAAESDNSYEVTFCTNRHAYCCILYDRETMLRGKQCCCLVHFPEEFPSSINGVIDARQEEPIAPLLTQ